MFRANRNRVSNRSEVGKTLNSTGRAMCIDTRSTITETVMFALIRMSSRKLGIGMIIAKTIPKTARGTPKSERPAKREERAGGRSKAGGRRKAPPRAFVCAELELEPRGVADPPAERPGAAATI